MTRELVAIAVLAKAPVPGFAKTRLIPALGTDGAAAFASRLIEHTVATACEAAVGPVTLWATPDQTDRTFQSVRTRFGIALVTQPNGDLGARMLGPLTAADGPALVIGTDCPALTTAHLRVAAEALRAGTHVVIYPAEDGGYVLIGSRKAEPALFSAMPWSTAEVMAETRRRLNALGLAWQELAMLWDVDTPADLDRLHASGLGYLIPMQN